LIAGARNQREVTDLDVLISAFEQFPPNEQIARQAYALMMAFARSHGLHALDALIAATAIENGFTLVSKNRKHFQIIGKLSLEVPDY
jgi:predicted nucleic acid-binding protein